MLMKTAAFIAFLALPGLAHAQAGKAIRELAEWLTRAGGRKVGVEAVEKLVSRYGDDAMKALRAGGPSALEVLETHGSKAMAQALTRGGAPFAREALLQPRWVQEALERCGPDAAKVIAQHPGVGARFLALTGPEGLQIAQKASTETLERLMPKLDDLAVKGRLSEGLSFIKNNGTALFLAAGAVAVATNPEGVLNGLRDLLGGVPVIPTMAKAFGTTLGMALAVWLILALVAPPLAKELYRRAILLVKAGWERLRRFRPFSKSPSPKPATPEASNPA